MKHSQTLATHRKPLCVTNASSYVTFFNSGSHWYQLKVISFNRNDQIRWILSETFYSYFTHRNLLLKGWWRCNGDSGSFTRDHPPSENQSWAPRTGVRKRGRCGGIWQRLKWQGHCRIGYLFLQLSSPMPSPFVIKWISFRQKFLSEYKNACLLALTEMLLKEQDPLSDLRLDSFGEPVRLDSTMTVTRWTRLMSLYK